MKKPWKRIIWIVIGAALLALVVYSFLPKPITIDTERVRRGTMQMVLEADGRTRVHDLFTVAVPVNGRLGRIQLTEGDIIARGTQIASVHPLPVDPLQRRELEGRIASADANRRQAVASMQRMVAARDQAVREADRAAQLETAGSISRQDRERAENAVSVATKELDAARFRAQAAAYEVDIAKAGRGAYPSSAATQASVVLRAPITGRVLRVLERSERVVPAGTPIVEMGDPAGLEIVIDVLSSDAVGIKPGTPVIIEGWGGDSGLTARVKYVEPSAFTKVSALGVEEQRVNVIAEFIKSPSGLGNAYRVDARFVLWEGANVLKVPTSALFRDGDEWSVYEVNQGKAHRARVRIGRRNAFEAEVTSGIAEGAEVIVHPSDRITDGVAVETTRAGSK